MTFLRNEWIGLVVRIVLGAVFIYASLDKIVQPEAFAKIVNNYHILPGSMVNLLALFLPWLELLTGVALVLGTRMEGATVLVGAMLAIFIVAVAISLARGLNIDCGCFSTSSRGRTVGLTVIFQDIGLLLMAIYAGVHGAGRWALDRAAPVTAP